VPSRPSNRSCKQMEGGSRGNVCIHRALLGSR
jgi:hypothetical protein